MNERQPQEILALYLLSVCAYAKDCCDLIVTTLFASNYKKVNSMGRRNDNSCYCRDEDNCSPIRAETHKQNKTHDVVYMRWRVIF